MSDVFNNPSNDYIYPALSPCVGSSDDQYLKWTENGLCIIKGSEIISCVTFDDLAIPVTAFNKEQKLLSSGEVTFIPGLTKGLCKKQQAFTMPDLVSDDESLNPYFFQVDLSVNYYKNFKYTLKNIEASANYSNGIDIKTALNLAFNSAGIKITSKYDPSTLTFIGSQDGYEFDISNVLLTIIDTSENSSSPFGHLDNAESYELEEDASLLIPAARYPNSAMQGIILRGIYPSDEGSDADYWVYVNHVTDYVVVYDTVDVSYYDPSMHLVIEYNPSTNIGNKPIITEPSCFDSSGGTISGILIDSSTVSKMTIEDCSINNSIIICSSVNTSYGIDSLFSNVEFNTSGIYDSSIIGGSFINNDSSITNSYIADSWTNVWVLLVNPSTGQKIYVTEDESLGVDVSLNTVQIYSSTIWDSSLNNVIIYDSSIYGSNIEDASLIRCTTYNCIIDSSTVVDSLSRIIEIDASAGCVFNLNGDSSTYYLKYRKRLDIGCSTTSTDTVISAGDYLEMITTNGLWKKVGDMYIWTSAPDPTNCNIKNLIDGFYVFNPHTFPVQIEYMVFV